MWNLEECRQLAHFTWQSDTYRLKNCRYAYAGMQQLNPLTIDYSFG